MAANRTPLTRSRLAICMFTHDGRCAELREGLVSVLDQLAVGVPAAVEICVTDNASEDGTEEMIRELTRSRDVTIRYERHASDLGLSLNMLACVELSDSDYCWILTSDDVLEPGSIRRVLELLEQAGEPPGVVVGKANFSFDLKTLADQGGTAFYPPQHERTVIYDDAARFIADCGLHASLVSTLVVERNAWLDALAQLGGERYAQSTIFPHLPIVASIARRDPRWVWCPAKLVRCRMGNPFLARDRGWSVEKIHARLLLDMSRMWRRHLGWRSVERRELMRRAHLSFAAPTALRRLGTGDWPWWRRLAALASYARVFWWLPGFWRGTVPALAAPRAPSRRRECEGAPIILGADERHGRVRVREIRSLVPNSHEIEVELSVENTSSVGLRSAGAARAVLGYRWFEEGALRLQGPALPLPRRLEPGRQVTVVVPVLTPSEPGDFTLQFALAQEGVGWFSDDGEADDRVSVGVRCFGWTDRPGDRSFVSPSAPSIEVSASARAG
jgi:glycosyltransferase involved in cell wall biosynthesis